MHGAFSLYYKLASGFKLNHLHGSRFHQCVSVKKGKKMSLGKAENRNIETQAFGDHVIIRPNQITCRHLSN